MRAFDWLRGLRNGRLRFQRRVRRRLSTPDTLEPRVLLAVDYGDAPDTGAGTGVGNYETLLANNGPSHTIVAGLFLGARVDGESDATQNATANGDDIAAGLDDEDGVSNTQADLAITIGTQPRITLRATNSTGTAATLWGWIDTNGDGTFDNVTERTSISVPAGTGSSIYALTFPVIGTTYFGKTFARFRLSSDTAASNPTGAASSGEVEDYEATLSLPGLAAVKSGGATKLASGSGGVPTLSDTSLFGRAITTLGDLDGDGITELAIGATGDSTAGAFSGGVYVAFMNANGTIRTTTLIASGVNGGPTLSAGDFFGTSVSGLGDLDGDGIGDLAVGAEQDDNGGTNRGAAYVLLLDANGTVKTHVKFGTGMSLVDHDYFGSAVAGLGDVDGDGVVDLAVGAKGDDSLGADRGSVHIFLMKRDGLAKFRTELVGVGASNADLFGSSIASLGDIDGDGVCDIAVGAPSDDGGGSNRGAVHIVFLSPNGTAKSYKRIASGVNGGPSLTNGDLFGSSVACCGDLDGDGVRDLIIGAFRDDTGGTDRGAVYVMLLNSNGTAKSVSKLANGSTNVPTINNLDYFGVSVARLGDIDGDGGVDLAVGAAGDDTDGSLRGAVHILRLDGNVQPTDIVISSTTISEDAANGTVVGAFSTNPPDSEDSYVYSLVTGTGSADNGNFTVVGSELRTNTTLDFEARSSYAIRIRTTDTGGLFFEKQFSITITNVNEAPTAVLLSNVTNSVVDSVTLPIKVAEISVSDDALGSETIFLSGADASSFEVQGSDLRLKAGTVLNSAIKPHLSVTINVDDPAVGGAVDASASHVLFVTGSFDYGDAPDTGTGTGLGNYQTLLSENGPRHTLTTGLSLGARVDGESDATPNTAANGDDRAANIVVSDDEDGVVSPLTDLRLTVGTSPRVVLRATNTTGTAATLYGWIDYNANGVFDNPTERTNIVVPNGTSNGAFTLTFPSVPAGFTGKTYARFRLSTDAAAASPTGTATDGEVEDYSVTITSPGLGTVKTGGVTKIANGLNGGPTLAFGDYFGKAVANMGDIDGDGVADLAVGADGDDTAGTRKGAVHILFVNSNGTVKSFTKIANGVGGGPSLGTRAYFGSSVTNLGDIDGDGVADLAVGASGDYSETSKCGAVYILRLRTDGTVKSSTKITSGTGGGLVLSNSGGFGISVANLGDVDGDGVVDLAVGAYRDDSGGPQRGAVFLLRLNADGTVKSSTKIASGTGGGPALANYDLFGTSLTSLGDLDGDNVPDLAVGARGDDMGGSSRGAVYVLQLNSDGTVKASTKVASGTGGGPSLGDGDQFGRSVANLGDFDGDGITDLAVGGVGDDTGGTYRGAVYLLRLNRDGTVRSSTKIANGTGGGPTLTNNERFGGSVANLGDIDGDGVTDLAVGAYGGPLVVINSGAVHVIPLNVNQMPTALDLSNASVAEDRGAGSVVGTFSTTDPDGASTFTYSLVSGSGAVDNGSFEVVGNELRINGTLDFETSSSLSIRVRTTEQGILFFEQQFTISVTDVNEAPISLALSATTVAENVAAGTGIGTLTTTDPDASNTFTYALVAGMGSTDNTLFAIVGDELRTNAAFDFESQSSYSIRVRTTDQGGLFFERTFTISVTNVNEAPTTLNLSIGTVDENVATGTTVGTFSTVDPDASNTFTYTLVTGTGSTDNVGFSIVSGQLRTNASLDFEAKSSYSIRVRTTDQGGLFHEAVFTINVTNVNETPTGLALSNGSVAENSATGTSVGTFTTNDPDAGNTFTYTLVTGTGSTHNALFSIVGNELRTNSVFNFEVQTSYSIRARTTDQGGLISERSFTISITNVNEQPTIVLLVITTVPENTEIATAFGTFETTDPDAANTFTYTLEAGTGSTDNALFSIADNRLRTNAVFDFETRSSYSIRVRTTDQEGLFLERVFTIGITDVFEAPTALALSNGTVAENSATGTGVGTFSTTDQDAGNTFTYTLVTGTGSADNGVFAIVGNQLQTNGVFDFEGRSAYSILVRTTDQGGLFFEQVFVISVTDVNEAPTGLVLSNAVLAEDVVSGTAVGTLGSSDQDAGNTFTYTLVTGTGGADNGVFAIDGDQLRTNGVFDFEGRSAYSIRVRTTDQGGLSFEQVLAIGITNVNETPTGVGLSNVVVAEDAASGAAVGTFSTSDPDGANTFTYSLVTGTGEADNGLFAIVGGELRTNSLFDFETRTSYSIRVRTTDQGGLFFERAFTIGVTNVNEAPTGMGLSSSEVVENSATGTVIGTLSATDPDVGNTFTYGLVAGAGSTGNGAFLVVGNELRVNGALNFEGQSSYSIRVRGTDQGGLFFERTFTVSVTDVNEGPTGLGLANNSVVENASSGTVVGVFSTTDTDAGDAFTYSLVNGAGGADNGAFAVVGNELRTGAPFDFEGRSSYSVRVRTTDRAGLLFERSFTITIGDVNEAPTGVNLSANLLVENAAAGTVIGTLSTVDPDTGNTHTVGLVAGAGSEDNGSFTISGGVLRSAVPLDYEGGRTRSIRVRATDGGGLSLERVFTISIGDVNEAPTDLVLSSVTVSEEAGLGAEIGTLSTVDQDAANTFGYSLTAGAGDADNGKFVVFQNRVRLIDAPDFETQPSYTIRIRTTDQNFLAFEKSFTITVLDVVETRSNTAPVLDASGQPFAILGVGSRQSVEMREGVTVASILARGAGGKPISDVDTGSETGIAITGADTRLGSFQYTLVAERPAEGDWVNFGSVSDVAALLLPETARVRFVTGLVPHHAAGGPFLPLESKLETGLTFRAWDRTIGTAGAKEDASTNGGTSAFSSDAETVRVYFEARLFRTFNSNAQLNVYALEAEFNALVANPAFVDRSTAAYSGFTILMSAVPELGTAPLFRMYFGVQFNDDGTETDMGYRYLTSSAGEAAFLEGLGRADKRANREGAYFRELGVNNGTAIVGYISTDQQPGTSRMTQVYRTDSFAKPTRPAGTREGGTPTSMRNQEQGDHVYTTNIAFETGRPGTWRVEAARGFVRELTPSPTGVGPALAAEPVVVMVSGSKSELAVPRALAAEPVVVAPPKQGDVFKLVATGNGVAPTGGTGLGGVGAGVMVLDDPSAPVAVEEDDAFEMPSAEWCDEVFADLDLVAACGLSNKWVFEPNRAVACPA